MPGSGWRRRLGYLLTTVALVAGVTAVVLAVTDQDAGEPHRAASSSRPEPPTSPSRGTTTAQTPTTTVSSTSAALPTRATTTPPAVRLATRRLDRLVTSYPASSISVAALDVRSGRTVLAGARRGMLEASVAKVRLLETLMLVRQRTGRELSDDERELAEDMIEDSDNDAANDLYYRIGGVRVLRATERALGIDPGVMRLGEGVLWGLTRSSAEQQIPLLRNLIAPSPLSRTNRAYALRLMRHVEDGQRWGAPVVADAGSVPAVKNGWLAVGADDGLWAVNSDGLVSVHGRPVLVSVMTQYNESMADGIDLVERLVRLAVTALR